MKQVSNKRLRFVLWVVVAIALVVMTAGTLFAAGEQLERGAVLSGGGLVSGSGMLLQGVAGLPVAGSDIASSGAGLCSGFGCDFRSDSDPDEPEDDLELFMPQIETNPNP